MGELVGDPETLVVDSTVLSVLDPRQVRQSVSSSGEGTPVGRRMGKVGFLFGLRSEGAYMLCATNRVPVSYELSAASTADVVLVEELFLDAAQLGDATARAGFSEILPTAPRCSRTPSPVGALRWLPNGRDAAR